VRHFLDVLIMRRRTFLNKMGALCGRGLAAGGLSTLAISGGFPPDRFRLGVISDELSQDFEEALKIMKGYGLRWVEIRTVWKTYNTEASPEQIQRLKNLLQQYDFTVSVLDTAVYKCDLPGTKNIVAEKDAYPYSGQMDLLKRAMDRAHVLGTDKLRVFAFWRVADAEVHFPRIAAELAKAAEVAGKGGMRLVLEDEGSCNVGCARELAQMLGLVPNVNLGANWDVGNGYWHGEVSFPTGYALLDKKRIWHMHLKDVRCGGTAAKQQKSEAWRLKSGQESETSSCHTTLVGEGEVDLLGQLRALLRDGYKGTMSLEPEYEAPGVTHQEATRRSLEALLRVMAG
jgi:L-ribulose-5-phosphate 3-epimerase